MEEMRLLTIHVEMDSRRLGGSLLLLPFGDAWLSSNTCRDLLSHVLVTTLDRPTALVNAEASTELFTPTGK